MNNDYPFPDKCEKCIHNDVCYMVGECLNHIPEFECDCFEEKRPHGEWIPVTYRDMDAEEIEQWEAEYGTLAEEDKKVFSCPMPEDGQDILISTKYGVSSDTCCYDGDAYWLDMHDDWDDVDAWMPYPKPYKKDG